MTPLELKLFVEEKIEAAKALHFFIENISADQAVLRSPLSTHLNHKGTAFGGSLYSLCAVASYSLILNLLMQNDLYTDDIVIAQGTIKYLKPVVDEIFVNARFESKTSKEIISSIRTGKRVVISVRATISSSAQNCADFAGVFVLKIHPT